MKEAQMSKKGGLGKGLDLLIPKGVMSLSQSNEKEEVKPVIQALKISEIEPNREQPRKKFDDNSINELADSIKQYGVIQPIVVCKKEGYYEIVTGERRWRAAKKAGLNEIPVVIREYTPQEIMAISLIENIQREDLNPIEEAVAYQKLLDEFQITQEELANRVSKSRVTITNTMRLLKLVPKVQEMLINEEISNGHARALLSLNNSENQVQVAQSIVSNNLSVRETESLIKKLNDEKSPKDIQQDYQKKQVDNAYHEIEEQLKLAMGTQVKIKNKKGNKGKIEIEYYSVEDLERIIELLNHKL
jgi:ParB family chromosome partitioning protein